MPSILTAVTTVFTAANSLLSSGQTTGSLAASSGNGYNSVCWEQNQCLFETQAKDAAEQQGINVEMQKANFFEVPCPSGVPAPNFVYSGCSGDNDPNGDILVFSFNGTRSELSNNIFNPCYFPYMYVQLAVIEGCTYEISHELDILDIALYTASALLLCAGCCLCYRNAKRNSGAAQTGVFSGNVDAPQVTPASPLLQQPPGKAADLADSTSNVPV